jgi:transcriptional regulator with XRE-family HTH domain
VDRPQLADFLRRHREALSPADVGLPDGARRRTPGLRREEVASLVGMSTDYLTRLEQQRGPQPSEQMLTALARGLRLSLDERDHLFRLAGHTPPSRTLRHAHVAAPLLRVLDRLDDAAALVLSDLGETLAQNRLAVALLGDHSGYTGLERSAILRWFTDPAERLHYPAEDRDRQGRLQVAQLRSALTAGARGRDLLDRRRLPGAVHRGPGADAAGAHPEGPGGDGADAPARRDRRAAVRRLAASDTPARRRVP